MKPKQKFRLPEIGQPARYDFNAKTGRMYINGQDPNSGVETMTIRLISEYHMPNAALYGLNDIVPKRDWRVIVFMNESNCACTAAFHSASDGAFRNYNLSLFATGIELHEVLTRVTFHKRTYKSGMSGYALSFEIESKTPDAELELWAAEEETNGISNYHACIPIAHIRTLIANNPADIVKAIAAKWKLTSEQIALTANPDTGEILLIN